LQHAAQLWLYCRGQRTQLRASRGNSFQRPFPPCVFRAPVVFQQVRNLLVAADAPPVTRLSNDEIGRSEALGQTASQLQTPDRVNF
jgi:hypothetical protein